MNTNRSGVKENAFAKVDPKVYGDNYDHIFGKKEEKKEEEPEDLECRICGSYCVSYPCGGCGYNGSEWEHP